MVILHNPKIAHLFLISICYVFAHGLGLFNSGLFWDDWLWFKLSPSLLYDSLLQLGGPWVGIYMNYIFGLPDNIFVVRLITFFSFYFSIILLYEILTPIKEITSNERLVITIFFAVFPHNLFRLVVSLSWYSISFCIFFVAFWLLKQYLFKGLFCYRFLSLFLFFISFTTNSFLVFYLLCLLYAAYFKQKQLNKLTVVNMMLRHSDFISLPIVFWIAKKLLFPSYGIYPAYNVLSLKQIALSPYLALKAFYFSFISVIGEVVVFLYSPLIVSTLGGGIVLFFVIKNMEFDINDSKSRNFVFLGLFCYFIAIFPYLAVGLMPSMEDFNNRHQLLTSLGIGIFLTYIIQYGISRISSLKSKIPIVQLLYAFLIVQFIIFDIRSYLLIQADWYKQVSILHQIKNNEIIRKHTTFLFKDDAFSMNAWGRRYRFYEYTALLKHTFGDEKRLGIDYDSFYSNKEWNRILPYLNRNDAKYMLLGDYKPKEPEFIVFFEKGKKEVGIRQIFELMKNERVDSQKFESDIRQLISLRVEKL